MWEIGALSINRKKNEKKKEGKKCAFVKVGGGAEDRTCGRGKPIEVGGCSIGIFQPGGDKKVKKKMIVINK